MIPHQPKKCVVCGRPLTVHQAVGGICNEKSCKEASIREVAAGRREAELAAMRAAAESWLRGAAEDAVRKSHALVVLPGRTDALTSTPGELAQSLIAHVRELLSEPASELEADPVSDRDNQAPPHEALVAACTTCRGYCCRLGGSRAFIDSRTMARVRAERSESDDDAIVAAYAAAVPAEHVEGSCVFHGAQGCTLPRELRSQICNEFYCAPVRQWFVGEGTRPGPSAIAVVEHGQVVRGQLID